jgi:hypothetical protein
MKKILAVVFSLGLLSTAFAQGGHQRDRDMTYSKPTNPVYNDKYGRNDGYFSAREKDAQIARINREFDYKIMAIKRNRYMRNGEKNREIRQLERQRTQEIRELNQRFSRQNSDWKNDRNDRNGRKW